MKLYRIIRRTTNSLQPGGSTFWNREVLYCGYDRSEALRVYHANTPNDYCMGYGNRCSQTRAQSKKLTVMLNV